VEKKILLTNICWKTQLISTRLIIDKAVELYQKRFDKTTKFIKREKEWIDLSLDIIR
jgi:hypothetical protein